MWVQVRTAKEIDGIRYLPGDWRDVDKRTARRWLAQGEIVVPPQRVKELLPSGSGIVVSKASKKVERLAARFDLGMQVGGPSLPFARTLIWDTGAALRAELVPVGFGLLETWQIAVPLRGDDLLVADVGTVAEQRRTQGVIHDLRVPVYNTSVIFAQDCEETRVLLRRWEREGGGDLAFLVALYQSRLLVLALPETWINEG